MPFDPAETFSREWTRALTMRRRKVALVFLIFTVAVALSTETLSAFTQ